MSLGYSPALRLLFSVLMIAAVAAGCRKTDAKAEASEAKAPAEKRYPLHGEIVEVKAADKVLIIHHEEIPDYMPAMTMEFHVGAGDIVNAKPGARIRGEMFVRGGTVYLEKIWPDDARTTTEIDRAAKALAQDTAVRGREAYREVGEIAPDFTLLDQDGRTVAMTRFRGKQVMLNFIFTRCPIATMCPAATARFQKLQKAAGAAGIKDLELVSVSLDPEYDTPGILREYADARGIDTSNWSFLTGPDTAVRQLLAQMGVLREFEGETVKHTLSTVLINEQGKIVQRIEGSQWDIEDFLRKMKRT